MAISRFFVLQLSLGHFIARRTGRGGNDPMALGLGADRVGFDWVARFAADPSFYSAKLSHHWAFALHARIYWAGNSPVLHRE